MAKSVRVFVYGTLRPGEGNWRLLADRAVATRRARLDGHALYGRHRPYPYAAPHPGGVVIGDVVEIDPQRYRDTLADLDALEDYRPGRTDNHYERRLVTVTLDGDGTPQPAWVYIAGPWARHRLTDAERIPSGDWLARDVQRCA